MNTPLLLALFFCHFLADFTHLSTGWMLAAKRLGRPLYPIFCHAFVHAFLMSIAIAMFFGRTHVLAQWTVVTLQLFTHFIIDVWKGRMNGWFPSLMDNTKSGYWVLFGLDQFAHAAVIIYMVQIIEAL